MDEALDSANLRVRANAYNQAQELILSELSDYPNCQRKTGVGC